METKANFVLIGTATVLGILGLLGLFSLHACLTVSLAFSLFFGALRLLSF